VLVVVRGVAVVEAIDHREVDDLVAPVGEGTWSSPGWGWCAAAARHASTQAMPAAIAAKCGE
jgi:hypothetical protein